MAHNEKTNNPVMFLRGLNNIPLFIDSEAGTLTTDEGVELDLNSDTIPLVVKQYYLDILMSQTFDLRQSRRKTDD